MYPKQTIFICQQINKQIFPTILIIIQSTKIRIKGWSSKKENGGRNIVHPAFIHFKQIPDAKPYSKIEWRQFDTIKLGLSRYSQHYTYSRRITGTYLKTRITDKRSKTSTVSVSKQRRASIFHDQSESPHSHAYTRTRKRKFSTCNQYRSDALVISGF